MSSEEQQPVSNGQLQSILKQSLEECVALARKKIRSKRGIADLQAILRDYHQNTQLASIILEVIKLIVSYESISKKEEDELKQTVTLDEYSSLEMLLQKCQASNREQIRNQQQLKIYCEELEGKNQDLQSSNKELLNSTKQIITNLKRQHQKLIEQNSVLRAKVKDFEGKDFIDRQKEQTFVGSAKKVRKMMDPQNSSLSQRQESSRGGGGKSQRSDSHVKLPRSSLSSIRANK